MRQTGSQLRGIPELGRKKYSQIIFQPEVILGFACDLENDVVGELHGDAARRLRVGLLFMKIALVIDGLVQRARAFLAPKALTAAVPESGQALYAIGDIHGRADLLRELYGKIDADQAGRTNTQFAEIILGDFIDRGPLTRVVVDIILARRQSGHRIVVLKGNHEDLLLRFLQDASVLKRWRKLGGYQTLLSYGVTPPAFLDPDSASACQNDFRAALSPAHLEFLMGLETSYENGGYFFAHAGVDPSRPLSGQIEEDLLTIRRNFLDHTGSFGKMVVHGHTPCKQVAFKRNRINIDTGAYATGVLTCLVLDEFGRSLLQT